MATKLSASFDDSEAAKRAIRALLDASVPLERIRLHVGEGDERREVMLHQNNLVYRGSMIGGAIGTALGLVTLVLMVAGVVPMPGVGFSDTRWLAIVQGAAIGLLLGWVTGVIVGLGAWTVMIELPKTGPTRPLVVEVEPFVKRVDAVRELLTGAGGKLA